MQVRVCAEANQSRRRVRMFASLYVRLSYYYYYYYYYYYPRTVY